MSAPTGQIALSRDEWWIVIDRLIDSGQKDLAYELVDVIPLEDRPGQYAAITMPMGKLCRVLEQVDESWEVER